MWVRSLCKHYYNDHLREENEEFEHSGPLYEHIEPAEDSEAPPQKGEQLSRQQKSAKSR